MARRTLSVIIVIMVIMMCAGPVFAGGNPATKLGRGLVNAVTSWIEIPKQVYMVSKEDNPFLGITWGVAKGVGYGVARLGAGVYDTGTFLVPKYDLDLMQPEYVFENWE